MKFFMSAMITGAVCSLFAVQYQIVPKGASFQLLRDGKVVVEKVESPLTATKDCTFKVEQKTLKDGSEVWNFISTDKRVNYRMEAALLNNGTCVEITSAVARPAKDPAKFSGPLMAFELNNGFIRNAAYEMLPKASNAAARKPRKGVLGDPAKFPKNQLWRWLGLKNSAASVIFDFNPFGVGYSQINIYSKSCCGVAYLDHKKDSFRITWPMTAWPNVGGYFSGKIRIKDGSFADYNRDHALQDFYYTHALARQYLFSFGSKKHGRLYTTADSRIFDAKRKWGWVSGKPEKTVTTGSGAYYSHQAGKDSTFRFTGLMGGLHLVTFGAGNPTGTDNKFSVSVNGQKLLENATIGKDRFLTATLPIWIDNGTCDVKITGNYIVSAIGNQFLLANGEDFTCRRGFWVSDSYEPSAIHNNHNSKPYALAFKPSVNETVLPPHGKEMAEPYRRFRAPRVPWNLQSQEYIWLFNASIGRVGSNVASFEEIKDPIVMESVLDDEVKKGKNAIMFTGLLSHHTYPKSEERIIECTKRFDDMAHRKGLKVIHHYDVTLLWNCEAGFRVLAETLDGVNRSLDSQLPGFQYCILSPYFRKSAFAHARKLLEAGTDALQMDEFCYVKHSCACPACLEAFHKDTGWYIPVDETHPAYQSYKHPLNRAIIDWKIEKSLDVKGQFRKELTKVNPNLIFSGYGSFYLTMSPNGLRNWMSDLMRTGRHVALMGKESQIHAMIENARMFVSSQKFYNYFRYHFGIPVYTWLYPADWKNGYFSFFVCLMNGQSPIDYGGGFADKSKGHMEFEPFESSPDAMNRQICREITQLGMLYSYQTVCNDTTTSAMAGAYGFAQTLDELHIPYVFLGDATLDEKYLKGLKVLHAGSSSCLDNSQIADIKKYVEKGGTVMMNTFAGTRNADGDLRKEWPFEKIMGFKPAAKMVEVESFSDGKTTIAPAFAKLKAVELLPAQHTKSLFTVKLKNGTTIPGMIEKPYGKGKILYFPVRMEELLYAPLVSYTRGEVCKFEYDSKMAAFYRSILRKVIGHATLLKTDAPEKVFMTLYREKDQVLVHLLNGTASGMKKGEKGSWKFAGNPFPALKKDITITAPYFGKNEVFAVSPDFKGRKKLAAKYNADGTVTFTLPKELLKGYTLIRIR